MIKLDWTNIYDVNGNWIKEIASTFLKSGSYELPIETDNLPNGVYFIELKTNADFEYSKFLIEK